MKILVRKVKSLNERTYTVGDTQYWKRGDKFFKWTEAGGRVECKEDEYMKAITGDVKNTDPVVDKAKDTAKTVAKGTESSASIDNGNAVIDMNGYKYKATIEGMTDEEIAKKYNDIAKHSPGEAIKWIKKYGKLDKINKIDAKVDNPTEDNVDDNEDLKLLKKIKGGDTKAQEDLINKYEPLVHKIANKYFIKGGDKEDLLQVGRIGVWNAIDAHDGVNTNFYDLARRSIEYAIQNEVRKDNTNKATMNNYASSLQSPATDGDGSNRELGDVIPDKGQSIEDAYLGREGAKNLQSFMKNELSPKELNIISKYIEGYSIQEIADDNGVKYKSVENAIMRVRNKIREYKRTYDESTKIRGNLTLDEARIIKSILSKLGVI